MTDELQPDDGDRSDVPEPQAEISDRPGVPWGLAAFLVGTVLLVVFVVQNAQSVGLKFLGWEGEYPLSLIIILVIAVSVILDEILGGLLRRRRRRRRAEKEELRRLRKER